MINQNQEWIFTVNSAKAQFDIANNVKPEVLSAVNSAIAQLQKHNLSPNIFSAVNSAKALFDITNNVKPEVLSVVNSAIAQLQMNNIALSGFSAKDQMLRAIKAYQIPDIHNYMKTVLPHIDSLDTSVLESAREFDLSKVEIHDNGAIAYDGTTYSTEQLEAALEKQIENAKQLTLREGCEAYKQHLWLVCWILKIFIFVIPQISDAIEFYDDKAVWIQEFFEEKPQLCATIRERSNLREEASMKATCIRHLPYDTSLEIIDSIPRWYQVKYVDENGDKVIGWIAKINVELEE